MARIGVLGPVMVDGVEGRLPPREQVVLAALVVRRGEVVSAETLADAWWGGRLPATWRKALQGCLVQLRKVFGAGAIETRPQGYCLVVPADEVDACRFERQAARAQELLTLGEPDRAAFVVDEALGLWRGRALVDLDGWEPGRVEAARLEGLRLDAEELRVEATLRAGRFRDVLAEAQARVSEEPLREHRWTLLALAQYQAGRQGDALRTLHRARRLLAEELGVDPGPDLVALEQAMLRQDPSLVTAQPPEPSPVCPYLGLVPYDVGDADAFFGRDADVSECLRRLADTGVLAVAGPSGSGKSSMVRAGIAAALERDGRRVVVVAPGDRPMDALSMPATSDRGSVLVVDQCEEAVTLCADAGERTAFFEALVEHAERAPLVVALRADRLGELSAHPGFARIVERGLFLLRAMGEEDLRAAIEGPARQAGLRLEAGLVDLLVRDVEGGPGALPLLSHALRQTWQRREGGTLTVAGYQASGGIRGAVAQSAEQLYEQASPERRLLLRDLLLRLVAPSPEGEPVRSRVPRRVVVTDPEHEQTIEQLIAARLVTSDEDVVELAHEALARAWPRLRGWLDDDVEGQRIWRHLAVAADSWEAMGRPGSELYRGVRLERAVEWRNLASPDLNTVEQAFLDTSRHAADTERRSARRRRRTLTAVLAAAAAMATALGSFAAVQADRATSERDRALTAEEEAQIGALVNRSLALRSTDRAAAALLAVEAYRRAPDDAGTRSALLGTFTASPGFMGYLHLPVDGQALAGAVVPGTDTAVVSVDGRELQLLDLESGMLEDRFPPLGGDEVAPSDETFSVVRVSANGRHAAHLVLTEADHPCFELDVLRATDDAGCAALLVYEVASGERVLGPMTLPVGPGDLAINADGSLVAVAGGHDGKVVVYRADSRELLGTVPGVPRPAGVENVQHTAAVGFGPDARLYAGSLAGPVRVVDPATLAVVASYDAPPLSTHNNLAVTRDGVVVGSGDTNLVAIDTETGAVRWSADIVLPGDPAPCSFFAVSEPVGRFYCGNFAGVLDERELATGQRTGVRLDPQLGSVGELGMTSDGRDLVAFGGDAAVVSRWRLDGGGPIVDASLPGWGANGYDPSGELMVVFEGERTSLQDSNPSAPPPPDFAAWEPATGEIVDELDELVAAIWVRPGVLGAAWADGSVGGAYDVRAHARIGGPPERELVVHNAVLSAGGTRTYVEGHFDDGSDGRCEVWSIDAATRRYIGPVIDVGPCPPVGSVAMSASADASRLAFTYPTPDGWATDIYDGRTGEKLRGPLLGQFTAIIGPDGTLFGGDLAGKVTQYDLETLEPIATFPQARGRIEALEFSVDGRLLLVGSANQTLSIYDVATRSRLGDPIDTGRPLVGGNAGPMLRPDGNAMAVNGRDGLAIWNLEPDHLANAACRIAGRNLTRAEWKAYAGEPDAYRPTCPDNP